TITFQGSGPEQTVLTYGSPDNLPTVFLYGADYVRFENITISNTRSNQFAWGVLLQNEANYNSIDSCIIKVSDISIAALAATSDMTEIYGHGNNANYFHLSNSIIKGGGTGVHLMGSNTD